MLERLIMLLKEGDTSVLCALKKSIERYGDYKILKDVFFIEADLLGSFNYYSFGHIRFNEMHDHFDAFFTDTLKGKIFTGSLKGGIFTDTLKGRIFDQENRKLKYTIGKFFRNEYGEKIVSIKSGSKTFHMHQNYIFKKIICR